MFLMNIKSVTKWLVMTEFEMLINVIGMFVFTILICLKCDLGHELSWLNVFAPLFCSDGLQAYFIMIVFLRQFYEVHAKPAVLRLVVASLLLASRFLFKFLIFISLSMQSDNAELKFQFAAFPLFFHLILLMFRSCRLKKHQILF